MSTSGIKTFMSVPPRGVDTAVSKHKETKKQAFPKGKSSANKQSNSKSLALNKKGFCDPSPFLQVISLMTQVESKENVPKYRGADYPIDLRIPHPGFVNVDTKESQLLVDTMRGFFTDKHYRFRISTALDMSSGGTGLVNSTISNSTLTSNTMFVALSSVFNEFFVEKFEVHWQPVSRYNYPLTGTSAISVANLPLGKASLQHGQTAYTSLSAMANNYAFGYHSTGDPFHEEWVNVEDSRVPTVVTTTGTTQAWTSVGNVANYLGSLQFRTQNPPPALPFTQVLGTFATHWQVLFRVKV